MTEQTRLVHRIDPKTRLFMYSELISRQPDENFRVPGNCVCVDLPDGVDPSALKTTREWLIFETELRHTSSQFGLPGTGTWRVIDDYRNTDLYLTTDGSKYSAGSEVEIDGQTVSYPGYDLRPNWLTIAARPSPYHYWADGEWLLDVQVELVAAKAARIAKLSLACQSYIYQGFESLALGQEHHYPALDKDQQNLTASVLDSTLPGLPEGWTTSFWCELDGVWAFRPHTVEQIQQAGRDAKEVIMTALGTNEALAGQVQAAPTKATVEAIIWPLGYVSAE